jgi:hypothetical protein
MADPDCICCPVCQTSRATQVELVPRGISGLMVCEQCGYCYRPPANAKELLRSQNELILSLREQAKRTVVEYRVTQTPGPLALMQEFQPRMPAGDGWKPMSIGGNEVVFYCLWKRESTVNVVGEKDCPARHEAYAPGSYCSMCGEQKPSNATEGESQCPEK